MCLTRLDSDKARQWLETGFVTLLLGLLLHDVSPHLAMLKSGAFLWRGLSASCFFLAKGLPFF